jgi:organic hydroperoxide reductase OsmC/OhrA
VVRDKCVTKIPLKFQKPEESSLTSWVLEFKAVEAKKMPRKHNYSVNILWTGNTGNGTSSYQAYKRDHEIRAAGKPPIPGSADPKFRGDPARYNPEELLISALSTCHMLWYLHLCADAGIVVVSYEDRAEGTMEESAEGGGRFINVTLRPHAIVRGSIAQAEALHQRAHELCFVANSVNFPVRHEAVTEPQII